jgi:hypothetical protein
MGNYHTRPIGKRLLAARFLQSSLDFPLMVHLGRDSPSWELNRWGSDTLRFSPFEQGRYDLRGNSRSLLYKGKQESHRFTILNNEQLEYDIILKQEPESNILYLLIEGWEGFDFFRQPDSSRDPKLAGSYAVYRKESIMQGNYHTGTGKICHIHRPKILDARGRDVWGDIWIDKGVLVITIPEHWLGEAKYPVVVDPIIGSSTVGAFHYFYWFYDEEYEENLNNWNDYGVTAEEIAEEMEFRTLMPSAYNELYLNRWQITESLQGLYKAFFHVAELNYSSYNILAPILLNESQNIPNTRISSEEYGYLRTRNISPLGWNNVTFKIQNTVAANSYLWFGMTASGMGISYDYGGTYFDIPRSFDSITARTNITNGQHLGSLLNNCARYISDYREALSEGDEERIEELRPSISYQRHNVHPKGPGRYDFKFSIYFQPVIWHIPGH